MHPSVAAKSLPELIAAAKAKPGEITYASPGRGTPQHLAMELFKLTAQVDLKHVPYTGSAGAVKDLVGGHVKAMFIPVHTVLPLARDGQLRVLAIGSEARSGLAPAVPTLAEEGMTGFDVDLWYGLLAPAATPPEIVARYNTARERDPGDAPRQGGAREAGARGCRRRARALARPPRGGPRPLGQGREGRRHHGRVVVCS